MIGDTIKWRVKIVNLSSGISFGIGLKTVLKNNEFLLKSSWSIINTDVILFIKTVMHLHTWTNNQTKNVQMRNSLSQQVTLWGFNWTSIIFVLCYMLLLDNQSSYCLILRRIRYCMRWSESGNCSKWRKCFDCSVRNCIFILMLALLIVSYLNKKV